MSPRLPPAASKPARAPGQVRIIGGRWRGSKLPVPELPGLRPSSDRLRETLFNWLQGELAGARVLDLFAGTGALGLEAASRGAARVDFVEQAPAAVTALRAAVARLGAAEGPPMAVHAADALAWLSDPAQGPFDLVFVDPPFAAGLWAPALAALMPRLAGRAWVYVESPAGSPAAVPAGWRLHRELRTREAHGGLYRVGAA